MNTTSTNEELNEAEGNAFVPLTETQMSSIRGGTSWPDWFVDMVGDIVVGVTDALIHIQAELDAAPIDFDEDYWEEAEACLQDGGFIPPDPGAP